MNMIDAKIVRIKSGPELKYGKWWVADVESYGRESEVIIMEDDKDKALSIKPGETVTLWA